MSLRFAIILIISLLGLKLNGLPLETYATASRLSEGKWFMLSVKQSGIHFIPASDLRKMGFQDPAKIRVHGYGATRQPEVLDSSYADDIPYTPTVTTNDGVYFYAIGPITYSTVLQTHLVPVVNPYTTAGFYYITESDEPLPAVPEYTMLSSSVAPVTTYQDVKFFKSELYNPGQTGHELLGDDFLSTATRHYNFTLPDAIAGTQAWLECTFYAKSPNTSRLVISVDDTALAYTSTDAVGADTDHYTHTLKTTTRKLFDIKSDKAKISINHSRSTQGTIARLGHIVVNYQRPLVAADGHIDFHVSSRHATLSGLEANTLLWDVTDPLKIRQVTRDNTDNSISITTSSNETRHFVAWTPGRKYPVPAIEKQVSNQNIHAFSVPDMVIFTHPEWRSQAERVALLHANSIDSLSVLIVEPQELYNEFSSGAPDAQALRKMLKMFYDRSLTGAEHNLRYLLIMGRSTYDNRRITQTVASLPYPTLPCWQTETSLTDNSSFTTDDIYSMLLDGAGANISRDYQCISVGRMPVISLADARNVVDKLEHYINTPINTSWKNKAIIVADDGNQGLFMEHSDLLVDNAQSTTGGGDIFFNKIYLDAYERQNSTYPKARADMFRLLEEGASLWTFAGHANPTSWTGDGLMTYTDINNLYIRHFPFVVAATCDFLRWDAREISAAEILYRTPSSGIIGAISATRPAIITPNGNLLASLGRHIYRTDENGQYLTLGEIYRCTKNNSATTGTWTDSNKLRYVLMGDPAIRLCTPSNKVVIDSINGLPTDGEDQIIIQARQIVSLNGHIADPRGTLIENFNGKINLTLYDAEHSVTSHGYGEDGSEHTFEQQGKKLHTSFQRVTSGKFTATIAMPSEISDNFRPAALDSYAITDDGGLDACSIERRIYVYGTDLTTPDDDTPPSINAMYLNHPESSPDQPVNTTPVLIAEISDDRAINLSSAGIGHQMTITLDESKTITDVPLYFTPDINGTPSGTIAYPLGNLTTGRHTLTLRIWDTSENSTSQTIEFDVNSNAKPTIYDLWSDANPAHTSTRFYLSHDRPNIVVQLTIEVFNLMGQRIWTNTTSGMGDHWQPAPVQWNLTDDAGRRVKRGIYLYRGTVTDNTGATSSTATRRIAVAAQ